MKLKGFLEFIKVLVASTVLGVIFGGLSEELFLGLQTSSLVFISYYALPELTGFYFKDLDKKKDNFSSKFGRTIALLFALALSTNLLAAILFSVFDFF